jgi:hypothetical protein
MGYPCHTRECVSKDDIAECLACRDGDNFIEDIGEPIVCGSCGAYHNSTTQVCHCGYNLQAMAH